MDAVQDGRIRDPIPSKLKGRALAASGNFSVMSVHLASKVSAESRETAAKRSSEGTIEAARLAVKERYVSISGRKLPVPSRSSEPGMLCPPDIHHQPCFNIDTRTEQARLLTLLRSLSPVLVVDQLCRALDFFGGKQGPSEFPEEDEFPVSAMGNGPGPLFISWISEIFPDVEETPVTETPAAAVFTVQPLPRDHLAGASRKSQAGFAVASRVATTVYRADAAYNSTASRGTDEVRGDSGNPGHALTPTRNRQTISHGIPQITRPGDTPIDASNDQPEMAAIAPKRPRGRPKGSRNKSRKPGVPVPANSAEMDASTYTSAVEPPASLHKDETEPKKRGRGRPKGSKNKPKNPEAPTGINRITPSTATGDAGSASGHTASGHAASIGGDTHELSLRMPNETSSGGIGWTTTSLGSEHVRHCQDVSLNYPRIYCTSESSSSNEPSAAVFDGVMVDVPVGRALDDAVSSVSKRNRRNGAQDQGRSARSAVDSREEHHLDGHITETGGTLRLSQPQQAFSFHQGSTSDVYFPGGPWH